MRWQVVQASHTGRVRRVIAKNAPTYEIACSWLEMYRPDYRRLEVRVQWPRLSARQRDAVLAGSPEAWRGARENGTMGNVMRALEEKGLAAVSWTARPYKRRVYRLTADGVRVREHLRESELATG